MSNSENNKLDKESDSEEYDYVNPNHYKKGSKEVWEMMVDVWGPEKFIAHCEMCAFKYRQRLGLKPEQPVSRDLEKAKWYESKADELRKLIPNQVSDSYGRGRLSVIREMMEFCTAQMDSIKEAGKHPDTHTRASMGGKRKALKTVMDKLRVKKLRSENHS